MSTNSGTITAIDAITPENHGGIAIVFITSFLLFSIAFSLIRLAISIQKRLDFGADDALLALCQLLAISQVVANFFAVHYGLGKHSASLTTTQINQFFKAVYSSQILAAVSMACAKFSVALLYTRLEIYRSIIANRVLFFFIAICAVFSFFALAFECRLPAPWRLTSSNCPNRLFVVVAVSSLNCLSDAALVVYPFFGIMRLKLPMTSKVTVLGLFSMRLLACAMSITDAIFTVKDLHSSDPTWEFLQPVITGIVLVNVSLITATVPRIHSFLATIPTGQTSTRLPSLIFRGKHSLSNRSQYPTTSSHPVQQSHMEETGSESIHTESQSNDKISIVTPCPVIKRI